MISKLLNLALARGMPTGTSEACSYGYVGVKVRHLNHLGPPAVWRSGRHRTQQEFVRRGCGGTASLPLEPHGEFLISGRPSDLGWSSRPLSTADRFEAPNAIDAGEPTPLAFAGPGPSDGWHKTLPKVSS